MERRRRTILRLHGGLWWCKSYCYVCIAVYKIAVRCTSDLDGDDGMEAIEARSDYLAILIAAKCNRK
jgi:hypothetical protein